ncbi:MAG: hypothetical protein SFU56_14950 [Capsulimonadales bacterium]|nr:hypothetical protein [Capsulimonadales bacterium]
MLNDIPLTFFGLIFAGLGGELFIRGSVGLAAWMRIPPGIIGATVAAFATSSPELSVAIMSSLSGEPQVSVGDAIGSNVVNIGAILGAALLLSPTPAPREGIRRDFPVALLAPLAIGVLSLDGYLSRADGIILLSLFVLWFIATVLAARNARAAALEGEVVEQTLGVRPGSAVLFSRFRSGRHCLRVRGGPLRDRSHRRGAGYLRSRTRNDRPLQTARTSGGRSGNHFRQ